MNETEKKASKYLGKKTKGNEQYSPNFLVSVPRQENREQYNIKSECLPFEGYDVWHAYEFSTMTENNLPLTRVMKMKYSCNSEFLVESKSLKLYLNSFNMSKFGKDTKDCLAICKNIIEKDLNKVLEAKVEINFLDNGIERIEIYKEFQNIMNFIDEKELKIENFKESPQLLKTTVGVELENHFLKFDALRSNCRVTHQPDFGDVYIYYKSKKIIDYNSLVQYLSSFRSEYHFHEECCEMIYKRLYDILGKDDDLLVSALYTRRGGIDICPTRYNKKGLVNDIDILLNTTKFARNGNKQ